MKRSPERDRIGRVPRHIFERVEATGWVSRRTVGFVRGSSQHLTPCWPSYPGFSLKRPRGRRQPWVRGVPSA